MDLPLTTDDGISLEAEWSPAPNERAAMVLCHPHPLHGGTMRSIVTGALYDALPAAGVSCLRFNFRGVGRSTGEHGDGETEVHDVRAALDAVSAEVGSAVPVVMSGWSFGADLALSAHDERISGWLAIAVPLRWGDPEGVASDPKPKRVILAENDEFQRPAVVEERVADWMNTEVEIIAGASHFFVGRTDRIIASAVEFVDALLR